MLHALVGGTPAYLDMSGTSGPGAVGELDDWVVSALLNPGSAMFREGNIVLAQEQGVTDAAGYLSVLAAISQGASRRGQIAAAVGRAEGALAHPLSVLTEAQLITPLADALKQRRTTFQVAEPVLACISLCRSERGTPRSASGVEGVVGGRRHRSCPDLRATLRIPGSDLVR